MNPRLRDYLLQTLGLALGVIPAIFLLAAFPVGGLAYLPIVIVAAVAQSKSLAFGALCSLLVVPGLALGMLHF